MDTSLPQNALLIETIQREAVNSSLLEAFLESAPQFVLQCSIVLRTGIISKFQNKFDERIVSKFKYHRGSLESQM